MIVIEGNEIKKGALALRYLFSLSIFKNIFQQHIRYIKDFY